MSGEACEAPRAGRDLPPAGPARRRCGKLVEAERKALAAGKDRKEAIYAAYDRFYKGDIAREFVRGSCEQGGLITLDDLDRLEGPYRRAGLDELTRASRSTS